MSFPELTHLQTFVLAALARGDRWGKEIRAELVEEGHRKSAPAFYQLMSRLEEAGVVTGWYEPKTVAGQTLNLRRYRITPRGAKTLKSACNFYARTAESAGFAVP